MGLSFHDESSLEEVVGSLRFASDPPKSNSETGTIGIVDQERRVDDFGVEQITDIERREDDLGLNESTILSLYIDEHWNV